MILKEYNEQSFKRSFITIGRKMSPKPPTPAKEDLPLDLTTNQRSFQDSIRGNQTPFKEPDSPSLRRGTGDRSSNAFNATLPICPKTFIAQSSHVTRSKSGPSRMIKNSATIGAVSTSVPTVSNEFAIRSGTSRLFRSALADNVNNSMRPPSSSIARPGKSFSRPSAVNNTFSKATTSRTNRPITWRRMLRVSNSSNRKIKWVPAISCSSNSEEKYNNQWIPVTKFPVEEQPVFHPVELLPRNRSPEEAPSLKFPWINPLNRIFLQETTADAGEADQSSVAASNSKEDVSDSGNNCDANNKNSPKTVSSPFHTIRCPLAFTSSGTEETSHNPFKITPQSTWAAQAPDGSSDSASKSILAPSKLTPAIASNSRPGGVFGCSIPLPAASPSSSILKPSALGASRLGGISAPTTPPSGASKRFCLPTVTISSPEEKPAFKLKPPVLQGASSQSFVPKTPFVAASSNYASPKRSSSELEPDSKKLCTRNVGMTENSDSNLDNQQSDSDSPEVPVALEDDSPQNCSNVTSPTSDSIRGGVNGTSSHIPSGGEHPEEHQSTVPAFVPLNVDVSAKDESGSKVNGVSSGSFSPNMGGGFIFGQNLQSRVTGLDSNVTLPPTNGEISRSEGNLFAEAATSLSPISNSTEGGKSLSESSRELSEKEQSLRRKYEEVEVVTGEENEKNVIQMNCKLYGWVNGSWQERGRGILRLNDREVRDELHSRLVIRTQGTLTVMLNAKVFAEMSIEKSNDKSVRFTATGTDGQPKIYLVMGSPKDITLLHNSLEYRVAAARSQSIDEKERAKID